MGAWVRSGKCVAILLGCVLGAGNARSVTIQWKPSPEAAIGKIIGYKIYYGPEDFTQASPDGLSRIAPFAQFVGSHTNVVITNLVGGLTYYFACVAVDTDGVESSYSNLARFVAPFDSPPPPPDTNSFNLTDMLPRLSLYSTNGRAFLAVSGPVGATMTIQRSTNPWLANSWITITNLNLGAIARAADINPLSTLQKAFIPALESFQDPNPINGAFCWYRLYMPLGYAIVAN